MPATQLPLENGDHQPTRENKPKHRIESLTHDRTRISTHNPRFGAVISDASVAPLVAEIKSVGQAQDAIGVMGADGIVELLAGARHREAMRIMGKPLRVRVFDVLPEERAISIAFREGRGSIPVSFWDKSASWLRLLAEKVVLSEAKLAAAVDEDKSVINRGLAFQKAPAEVLALFADRQTIGISQWMVLAPLLENQETRSRILALADELAGQTIATAALVKKLAVAAAGKQEIKPREVTNRHSRVIATMIPDHKGGFTIKVKPMGELHPSYRIDYAKLIHAAFVDCLKDWFDDA